MDGHLKIITGPTSEPVTVDDVKTHTHIDHDADDNLILSWIKSGREIVEGYQRRAIMTQTLELTLDKFPDNNEIYLPRPPLIAVSSFKYFDYACADVAVGETWALTNFIIDSSCAPARMALAYNVIWPDVTLRAINAIKIRYTAGYGATASSVPENVKDAIMLYCAYRNENRSGEVDKMPRQFYDLLAADRIYL